MAEQKKNDANHGSQRARGNPYAEEEYQPSPGRWDFKHVREGKERDKVDWKQGKDVVS